MAASDAKGTDMEQDQLELLAQVASWYYEEGLDQKTIAERISRSRSMVSRLLDKAREVGLVEVHVRSPLRTDPALGEQLRRAFGLTDAIVLAQPPTDYRLLLRRLGELGARALQPRLHDQMVIGVGWGTAVHAVVQAAPEVALRGVTVVQLIGAIGHGDPLIDGNELARWLAQKLGGSFRYMPAPVLVETEEVAQTLMRDRTIADTLEVALRSEVVLTGIGTVNPELSGLLRAGYLSKSDLADFAQHGVVGDILGFQIDAYGRPANISHNRRVIGLPSIDALRRIPCVIAVSGSRAKSQPILAALRGGYCHVLVTDADAAAGVLELQRKA
jgi:DNA-binding transcriptional regulator LsrR (DeoR family)